MCRTLKTSKLAVTVVRTLLSTDTGEQQEISGELPVSTWIVGARCNTKELR
jgi:hypothetical protein